MTQTLDCAMCEPLRFSVRCEKEVASISAAFVCGAAGMAARTLLSTIPLLAMHMDCDEATGATISGNEILLGDVAIQFTDWTL